MLDEVDLVDVAAPDGGTNRLHCTSVLGRGPATPPLADLDVARMGIGVFVARSVAMTDTSMTVGPDGTGGERHGARLGRGRARRAAQRVGKPVTEIDVRDEPVGTAVEEAFGAKRRLYVAERGELEHQ